MTWEEIKQNGSVHYKTGSVEPIDLLRDLKPHQDLTALEVKALTDCIKYAFRMLQKGTNASDLEKIQHYTSMCQWRPQEESDEARRPWPHPNFDEIGKYLSERGNAK